MASPQLATSNPSKDSPTINSQAGPNSISNQSSSVYQKAKVSPHQPSTNNNIQALSASKVFPPPITTKSLNKGQRWHPPQEVSNVAEPTQKTMVKTDSSMEDASKEGPNSALGPLHPRYTQGRQEEGTGQGSNTNPAKSTSGSTLASTEKEDGGSGGLGGLGTLPSIATAASAMQIDGDHSPATPAASGRVASVGANGETVTAGPNMETSPLTPGERSTLVDAMQGHVLSTPLSAHSMPGESLSAITPTTPGFSMSATTPTTPFSPSLLTPITPGSGRGRHTCNHCSQTFTRHHNLKSHLLTHSHEKPYVCTSCQARFRRLHDLKRHTKLHTGERPHMCDKCGRRFARGDALARHARGEGGCAGRRSSMTGMATDPMMQEIGGVDGGEDISMLVDDGDGDIDMVDGNDNADSPADLTGGNGASANSAGAPTAVTKRHASLPSIKTNMDNSHLNTFPHIGHPAGHALQPHNTFPPVTPARSASTAGTSPGGLFPPTPNHGGNIRTPSTTTSSAIPNSALGSGASPALTGNPHILQPGNLSDSPRSISPSNQAGDVNKKASFSYSNRQPQQQSILPSPMTPKSASQPALQTQTGKYPAQPHPQQAAPPPPPPSLQQSQPTSQQPAQQNHPHGQPLPPQPNQNQNKQVPQSSNGANAITANPNMFENEIGIWDYVAKLERRLAEVERELSMLKQQHHNQAAAAVVAKVSVANQAHGLAQPHQQQLHQLQQQEQGQGKSGIANAGPATGTAGTGSANMKATLAGGGEG